MRGRPLLHTSYESDSALLPSTTKKVAMGVLLAVAFTLPLQLIPGLKWLGTNAWLVVLATALIYMIGALGLNILTGLAGQVSLGHAFFMGMGAYVAAYLGGATDRGVIGLGLPMWVWLPAAGIAAALVGVIVAPTAVRVRGLYLAFVTIALVFIGDHIFRNVRSISGGPGVGRRWPALELRLWKEETPLLAISTDGSWFGIELSRQARQYIFLLVLAILFALFHKNIARSRLGRAFAAIRDRDIAAEVMGVDEVRYKTLAFAASSFFAGVAGALLASFFGSRVPEAWDLLLSVSFIAIVLIGGAGTTAGTIMGSFFVVMVPQLVQNFSDWLADLGEGSGPASAIARVVLSTGPTDFGLITTSTVGPGLSVFQLNLLLYGLLIVLFLIFEPLGLYGIWLRVRNYWKGWPFSY
ncbi:MAG: branched-chain amino acid ABC transporter permease [Actinobacteria bacterium]|nr:branched-chain amino acid ABC transporter permease [Actinomycetota bacterium]MDQ3501662.1 branched-chain amino acid ABC transporter permease [Actinomycetota bacterium]